MRRYAIAIFVAICAILFALMHMAHDRDSKPRSYVGAIPVGTWASAYRDPAPLRPPSFYDKQTRTRTDAVLPDWVSITTGPLPFVESDLSGLGTRGGDRRIDIWSLPATAYARLDAPAPRGRTSGGTLRPLALLRQLTYDIRLSRRGVTGAGDVVTLLAHTDDPTVVAGPPLGGGAPAPPAPPPPEHTVPDPPPDPLPGGQDPETGPGPDPETTPSVPPTPPGPAHGPFGPGPTDPGPTDPPPFDPGPSYLPDPAQDPGGPPPGDPGAPPPVLPDSTPTVPDAVGATSPGDPAQAPEPAALLLLAAAAACCRRRR